jgi:hypothetical protein
MSLHNSLINQIESIIDAKLAPLADRLRKLEDRFLSPDSGSADPGPSSQLTSAEPIKRGPGRPRKNVSTTAEPAEGFGSVPE